MVSVMENIHDTPEGFILESLLEGMNQYYSMELSQKIKRGMNESRLKGNFTGDVLLFGYRVKQTDTGKNIVVCEEDAEIVRELYEIFIAGTMVSDLIADLKQRGIQNKGRPFARTAVYSLLANEKYAGIYRIRNEVYTNIYPRIVPDSVFEIAKAKIAANKTGRHVPDVEYLLKNKVTCGYCGKTIASESGTSKSGKVMRYYKCTGRKRYRACSKAAIRKDVLKRLVIDTTLKVLGNADTLNELAEKIMVANKKRLDDQSILNLLLKEKAEIDRAINNLVGAIEKGILTNSTKTRLEELELQQHELEEKIACEKAKATLRLKKEEIIRYLRTGLKKKPQVMIQLLIKKIVLYDDKVEIYYNYIDNNRPDDFEHQAFSFYTETKTYEINAHKIGTQPTLLSLEITLFI